MIDIECKRGIPWEKVSVIREIFKFVHQKHEEIGLFSGNFLQKQKELAALRMTQTQNIKSSSTYEIIKSF